MGTSYAAILTLALCFSAPALAVRSEYDHDRRSWNSRSHAREDSALSARDTPLSTSDGSSASHVLARAEGDDQSGAGLFGDLVIGGLGVLASTLMGGSSKPPSSTPAAPAAAPPKRRDFVSGDTPLHKRKRMEVRRRSPDELD
ncbi:hypothetical protein EIP91_006742 [Steccherinum ochraceum]|uniref:Uncharacterized protein n=1 Tax=Steccherinum ochraceum TaxID=92696 RepID=A0A4R0RJU2_9APHY|nr:hypothetical protein EIP91_006742 [Steccherinum ochraceum]